MGNDKTFNCASAFSVGTTQCYEALSSDMQKNALAALVQLGAVKKKKMSNGFSYSVNQEAIHKILDVFDARTPVQKPVAARL